jgi:hypothetical protein
VSEDGGASATADFARGDKRLMQRGAVRSVVTKEVADAGPAPGMTERESGDGPAIADCARDDRTLLQRGAVRIGVTRDIVDAGAQASAGPGSAGMTGRNGGGDTASVDCARDDKGLMQRGAVRSGRESGGGTATADRKRSDKGLMQRGVVVRFGAGPFRWRLSNSTAGNDPAADELATQAERAGEWTVVMAIRAAQQAGKDWRPGVAEARRRMVEDANRLPTRCMLRVRSVADIGRLDDWPGGT